MVVVVVVVVGAVVVVVVVVGKMEGRNRQKYLQIQTLQGLDFTTTRARTRQTTSAKLRIIVAAQYCITSIQH
jgi:hypothetical protein